MIVAGGEVHLARLSEASWREQLLRMRGKPSPDLSIAGMFYRSAIRSLLLQMIAGGLNTVAVYVFWIHHEEQRGVFTFTGRRDVRKFVTLAGEFCIQNDDLCIKMMNFIFKMMNFVGEVGLKVLMRVGPWDHG